MSSENKVQKTQKKNKELIKRLKASAPELFRILEQSDTLEMARERTFEYCNRIDRDLLENHDIHPLEWSNAIDCLGVFKNTLARRNEKISGVSSLRYLWMIARDHSKLKTIEIKPGFFEEFIHLFKGMHGKSGLHLKKQLPDFVKLDGREAAKRRSDNLDEISKYAESFIKRYPTGLDKEMIAIRNKNKKRILKYFNASEDDWNNWHWHVKNIVKDSNTLSDLVEISTDKKNAIDLAIKNKVPFGITPYYLSLIDQKLDAGYDIPIRAQVIPPLDYITCLAGAAGADVEFPPDFDFMLERDTSPIDLVTRRYPKIAIFKPYNTCPQVCVYCQRNWEIDEVNDPHALAPKQKIEDALTWFENHPEVTEILITGGDPFNLGDSKLEYLLKRFSKMKHVERIRIGSRTLVTIPMRITDSLSKLLDKYHNPPDNEICIVTHFQHVGEITPDVLEAVQRIRRLGISIYNQQVFTFYVSRRFETTALRRLMKSVGIDPYYTFNTKGKKEMQEYLAPIARLLQERREEIRLFPGSLRLDEPVYNVPKLGKNYLKAWQNHEMIMITPNGTRIYEFHPWEKNINPVHTYITEDVSIYQYLQKLKAIGEDISNYKSIWYYF